MTKAFSVVSWNVEHFGATSRRSRRPKKPVGPIVDYMAAQSADVYAIYEVVGSVVWSTVISKMPDYQWHITEGPQSQEILVGVRKTLTAFFTQKLEYKSGTSSLRPGALLTITKNGQHYPLLFLHLKSMSDPRGFGIRDDQTQKALDFRKKLDRAAKAGGESNYIFLGDLNTMGMNLTYLPNDVSAEQEISRLKSRVARRNMVVLDKAGPTYWPGSGSSYSPGQLDHVVAAEHLRFKSFGGQPVDIRGWPEQSTNAQKDAWAKKYSDHALLYFEVQRP